MATINVIASRALARAQSADLKSTHRVGLGCSSAREKLGWDVQWRINERKKNSASRSTWKANGSNTIDSSPPASRVSIPADQFRNASSCHDAMTIGVQPMHWPLALTQIGVTSA